ncbi:MAG: hypothetical protein WCI73_17195 [Phycisphaerae bacterium]
MFESETSQGLRPAQQSSVYAAGSRVRVTQQIPMRDQTFTTVIEGIALRQERQGSGSWFARNKREKFWLDRLVVQKDDGEISILNLDEYSRVEVLSGAAAEAGTAKQVSPNADRYSGVS